MKLLKRTLKWVLLGEGFEKKSDEKTSSFLNGLSIVLFLLSVGCILILLVVLNFDFLYRIFTGDDSWAYVAAVGFLVMVIPCFVGTVFFGSLEEKSTGRKHKVNLALTLASLGGGVVFLMLGTFFPMMVLL